MPKTFLGRGRSAGAATLVQNGCGRRRMAAPWGHGGKEEAGPRIRSPACICLCLEGFTRPRSGCTSRRLPTGLLTAPFVLASSIWLLKGPPLNDLIATVKVRRSATFSRVPCADSPTLPRLRAEIARGWQTPARGSTSPRWLCNQSRVQHSQQHPGRQQTCKAITNAA